MKTWQLQAAKAKFSEVVKQAAESGPQEITLHGHPVVVVISRDLFERLSGNGESLADFMRKSPLHGREDVDLARDRSLPRKVKL